MLKMRSDLLQWQICRAVHKNNGMGISHRHAGHAVCLILHSDLFIDGLSVFRNNRNLCRRQDRLAHIHTDRFCHAVFHRQIHIFHFSAADNGKPCPIGQSFVMGIFCHAADAVSAHFRPCAVCVIHLHLKICFVRRIDKNNAIAADPEMTVAGKADKFRLLFLRYMLRKSIDINVIIPTALHFCKSDLHKSSIQT